MYTKSLIDSLIIEVDKALRSIVVPDKRSSLRQSPADNLKDTNLSAQEKKLIAGLMRVNHAGEVSAQALYQGQALTAELEHVKENIKRAAMEENDHLAWCEQRLVELQARPSLLNCLWYSGSFLIGALLGP